MKRQRVLLFCATAVLLLGCFLWRRQLPPDGVYVMETSQDCALPPTLFLNHSKGSFEFMTDSLSSALPHGTYEIQGNKLTACWQLIDGQNLYVFEILDSKTLRFCAGQSAEIHVWDSRLSPPISDGAIFRLETEGSSFRPVR